ncbi:hypothetical protein C0995_015043 [Termitomyces sp. Mi166|nr:hypothetical protein C0995_015043 [Termitomyces sp. Mi166\
MPSLELPQAPRYVHIPASKENLDYADLPVIDLSKASTLEGRISLSAEVRDAMTEYGFFYVVNHGYTTAQTERIFNIANMAFEHVTSEEKAAYVGDMKESGSFQGYKPRQYWHTDKGASDQVEIYGINRDVSKREHPQILRQFLPEISQFARHNHLNVLHPILRIFALGMELPEETLVNFHGFESIGETYVRLMKYYPRSSDVDEKAKDVWLIGHTDIGSVTILYSQPVSGLQILSRQGTWKWVKHIENALVINVGDALEFLSGVAIWRVVKPPEDQRHVTRLGVFYFGMTDDDVKLVPLVDSPVLQRVGITRRFEDDAAPTMGDWRKGRMTQYSSRALRPFTDRPVEEDAIAGGVVKHYN